LFFFIIIWKKRKGNAEKKDKTVGITENRLLVFLLCLI